MQDKYTYTISWSRDKQVFQGKVDQFPQIVVKGDTPEKTLSKIKSEIERFIKSEDFDVKHHAMMNCVSIVFDNDGWYWADEVWRWYGPYKSQEYAMIDQSEYVTTYL